MPIITAPNPEKRSVLVAAYTKTLKTCSEDCSICLEAFAADNPGVTVSRCKHKYHHTCLLTWTEQKSTCPMCRQQMFVAEKREPKYLVPFETGDFVISEVVYQQWKESAGGEEAVGEFKEFLEEEGAWNAPHDENSGRAVGWW